jgi:pyruvate,orthophosphate dikinase
MRNGWPEGLTEEVATHLELLEKRMGRMLGDPADPLLVSVRSGAEISMPGMMDTVLNLGLNDASVAGLAKQTGDERFALDSYRRFIQMYARIVLELPGDGFDEALRAPRADRCLQGDRRGRNRPTIPERPIGPTARCDRSGVLLVEQPAREHLPRA